MTWDEYELQYRRKFMSAEEEARLQAGFEGQLREDKDMTDIPAAAAACVASVLHQRGWDAAHVMKAKFAWAHKHREKAPA